MRDLTLSIPSGLTKKRFKGSVSTKILNLSILSAIVFLSLLYLFEVNSLGTQTYQIRKLEQQMRQVEEDQKNLQIQSSDLQSINHLQESVQTLNFVPSTNVIYLKDSDFAFK